MDIIAEIIFASLPRSKIEWVMTYRSRGSKVTSSMGYMNHESQNSTHLQLGLQPNSNVVKSSWIK